MKINWGRVITLMALCGVLSGLGMTLIAGVIGLGVGFVVFLTLEVLV